MFSRDFYRLTKSQYAAEAGPVMGQNSMVDAGIIKAIPPFMLPSVSLAALEVLVHIGRESVLDEYTLFSIDIPDAEVAYLAEAFLPPDWRHDPAPLSTMDLGTGWLQSAEGAALMLPSTIIPMENNAILNPLHPAFSDYLPGVKALPFMFDRRLIGHKTLAEARAG